MAPERPELTPEQAAALNELAAGTADDALALAKILRPRAQALEARVGQLATPFHQVARAVFRLLQFSDPAFLLVDSGQVSVDQATEVGRFAEFLPSTLPREVRKDFELKAMTALAEGEPLTVIEKIANDMVEGWKNEQQRLESLRIAQDPWWSWENVLSWIVRRDPSGMLTIRVPDSRAQRFYGRNAHEAPERWLIAALKHDELKAHRNGVVLGASYWAGKTTVDRDVHFEAEAVRRLWPRWLTWNEAIEVEGGHYAAAGQRLVDLLPLNTLDLHALVPTGNPSNPSKRVRVVEVKPGATKSEVTVVIADDVVIEGGIVTELRSRVLAGEVARVSADRLLFAEPALRAALATTEPAPAADRSTPQTQVPAADRSTPQAPGPEAPKHAPSSAYENHQRATKKDTGLWASRKQDDAWAKDGGYSTRHVRDTLRPAFKKKLSPAEQVEFEKAGRRRN